MKMKFVLNTVLDEKGRAGRGWLISKGFRDYTCRYIPNNSRSEMWVYKVPIETLDAVPVEKWTDRLFYEDELELVPRRTTILAQLPNLKPQPK